MSNNCTTRVCMALPLVLPIAWNKSNLLEPLYRINVPGEREKIVAEKMKQAWTLTAW